MILPLPIRWGEGWGEGAVVMVTRYAPVLGMGNIPVARKADLIYEWL
jgi:hypothetical protein